MMLFTKNTILTFGVLFAIPFLGIQSSHSAEPKIKIQWKYYEIKGASVQELKKQMKRKGPKGFWAYAKWNVKWTGKCKVTVNLKYTFPRWTNKSSAPAALQADWNKMIVALKRHEENHGKHGINAGREISATGCKKPKRIIGKWAKQDKIYDRQTKHGRKEGVKL